MPGRNGTGPMGAGAMTGRGFGPCAGGGISPNNIGLRRGMACRRGFGRGFRRFSAIGNPVVGNRRDRLQAEKDALTNRLAAIDRQLESL
jgi:hypothetical protein